MNSPTHKTLLAIDFDHTLFHTTLFVQALADRFLAEFGIARSDFFRIRDEVKACCAVIDIDTFIQLLPREDKKSMHSAIEDVIAHHASSLVFSDVRPFLREAKELADILIITHADTELQTKKIQASNLGDIPYHISTDDKALVLSQYASIYDQIIFVDDKPQIIEQVKKQLPKVRAYFLVRPDDHPYKDSFPTCQSADATIASLEEIDLQA